jgi:RimJ/RimL family protein N-acetyltransferase
MTRRLVLTAPEAWHREATEKLAANPRVAENRAASPCPETGDAGQSFILVLREGRMPIGQAAFGPTEPGRGAIEIAVWIGEPYWGRGYATEATQAVIDRAFDDQRVGVLWCSNRASNTRARRVIEKCAFQFRGTGMARAPFHGGAIPVERFALERRNWRSLKEWGEPRPERDVDDARHNAA